MNPDKQHTLKGSVTLNGVGLHTGEPVTLTLRPAPVGHGLKFQRTDLEGEPVIDADADLVVSTERGTTLGKGDVRVNTTEHVLSALYALGVDNCLVQLTGPEVPIMDGSALPFVEAIEKAGLEEQNADRDWYLLTEPIWFETKERGTEMLGVPAPGGEFRLTVMVDYNSPVLGTQHASMYHAGEFKSEIAPCRTFVFLRELELLAKAGLIKGGDLNNAIVLEDREGTTKEQLKELARDLGREYQDVEIRRNGVLNTTDLKFFNEPARHKLLDIVGDLALVGRPIKGHILAARPGHFGNTSFAKRIKEKMRADRKNPPGPQFDLTRTVYDINQIEKILPHRYPFLLVDRIIALDKETITGVKNITMNEPQFTGHFPGNPVMPGVLQVEAMAQVGGIFALSQVPDPENYTTYFLKIDGVRFKRKVIPGDTIIFHLNLLTPIRRGIVHMKGIGYVNGQPVLEAEMMAQIARDKAPKEEPAKVTAIDTTAPKASAIKA
ncbi:MAG: bifunctional UDP-3-O-[3-hydroxymyristoyl] N-acetylglucosamine deacetylase/3-hydroxyacyl-ACP dehydratase [Bacteroidetes bacterium]|mgnify:CR=1 FL=1|nr:bifunctional UDP-3-O-[3-hydroxymyristoyl] N-acetylglucosamine deacetylase/3-hydroxyacyl-ACP dehydratase [Bacteroidota bacterium]MBX7129639.1 bifunctional UDP-3-O-[3-hydroxymyristoyl] N-acetylglucosamine deacetylase/3-hydroxyacyl-ACP dehydratase [Flavobacteriales bacterium]MCC6655089.1 bifunctional UDP-3-O-[3-hydroxymyristoyl] N-acetylglucosamine deacetylase/3-hydroxyacyl-ACP dehydratase [Flavobacteriales bacterium]HMU14748.1 bifunctional UDP-3-O-[3-hydroxymyristoyl] N-acetylglucosamine deacet